MGTLGKMRDAWLKAQAKSLKQSKETGLAFLRQGAIEVASALHGSSIVARGSAEQGMPWTRLSLSCEKAGSNQQKLHTSPRKPFDLLSNGDLVSTSGAEETRTLNP